MVADVHDAAFHTVVVTAEEVIVGGGGEIGGGRLGVLVHGDVHGFALVDSVALARLIAEHPEVLISEDRHCPPAKLKFRRLGILLFNRRSAPKNLLFALFMAVMYFLTANPAYLLCSAALMVIALLSLRRAAAPEKLF